MSANFIYPLIPSLYRMLCLVSLVTILTLLKVNPNNTSINYNATDATYSSIPKRILNFFRKKKAWKTFFLNPQFLYEI
jgi:hypothetical protein